MQKFLKPKKDTLVRDPDTREALPPQGMLKTWSRYWRRRVKCGDCIISQPPKSVKKKKEK